MIGGDRVWPTKGKAGRAFLDQPYPAAKPRVQNKDDVALPVFVGQHHQCSVPVPFGCVCAGQVPRGPVRGVLWEQAQPGQLGDAGLRGLDPDTKTKAGWKALDVAVQRQDAPAIEYLLGVTRPRETAPSAAAMAEGLNEAAGFPVIRTDLLARIRDWERQGLPQEPIVTLPKLPVADLKMPALEAKAQGLGKDIGKAAASFSTGLRDALSRRRMREEFDRAAAEATGRRHQH